MPTNYIDCTIAANMALQKSYQVDKLEMREIFQQEAMIYALLALAGAIHEKKI